MFVVCNKDGNFVGVDEGTTSVILSKVRDAMKFLNRGEFQFKAINDVSTAQELYDEIKRQYVLAYESQHFGMCELDALTELMHLLCCAKDDVLQYVESGRLGTGF